MDEDAKVAQELFEWVRGERSERPKLRLKEKVTLKKYDGEYEPGKTPIETIVIEDGVVQHFVGETEAGNAND
jgi:hypothetical protein